MVNLQRDRKFDASENNKTLELNFILTHFPEPVFPRTVSTYKSKGMQFEVFSEEDIIKAYDESNYLDCRVNAYPSYTEYKGIQRYPPNFIFADLDGSSFKDAQGLERALDATLKTIRFKINGSPTVLWTGNGYHIYQPIDAVILEQLKEFEEFEHPSTKFLRFSEQYLSSGRSDQSHNPSFKSCMIRIPGTFNSKGPRGKNEVKIFQKWDGYRPPISLLLSIFHAYLVSEKLKKIKLQKRIDRRYSFKAGESNYIKWIEILLKTPIEDYRKNAIGLILAPYLINIKKILYEDAFQVIKNWLDKCNELRCLDSNFDYTVKYSLNTAIRKQQLPMKFETLSSKNGELHQLLTMKIQDTTQNNAKSEFDNERPE